MLNKHEKSTHRNFNYICFWFLIIFANEIRIFSIQFILNLVIGVLPFNEL
jgi:hypothetical protein